MKIELNLREFSNGPFVETVRNDRGFTVAYSSLFVLRAEIGI